MTHVALRRQLRACCNRLREENRTWTECSATGSDAAMRCSNAILQFRDLPHMDLGILKERAMVSLIGKKLTVRAQEAREQLHQCILQLLEAVSRIRESTDAFFALCADQSPGEMAGTTMGWRKAGSLLMEVSTMFSQAAATQHRIGIGFRILAGGKEVVLPTPVHRFSLSQWARGTTYSRSCAAEELEAGNIGIGVKPDFDRRETERTMQVYLTAWKQQPHLDEERVQAILQVLDAELAAIS